MKQREKECGGVVLFVPLRLAPNKRKCLNNFEKLKIEPLWVECRYNYYIICRPKVLLNVTYNPLEANQNHILEQLLSKIDNATCESLPITMMGDYNLNSFPMLERENLETIFLPWGFSVADPTLLTRVCKVTIRQIDYILTEKIPDERSFVFDSPFETDNFGCALLTDITVERLNRLLLIKFD